MLRRKNMLRRNIKEIRITTAAFMALLPKYFWAFPPYDLAAG